MSLGFLSGRLTVLRAQVLAAASMLLWVSFAASAANYYVDYAAGSDANAGTSASAPWKHCPGDTTATGGSASAILQPGDTVYFKGGTAYVLVSGGITPTSGSYGNPVTYDGNTTGGWGTGAAIITDKNSTNSITAFRSLGALSNIVFRGIKFANIGGGPLPPDPGSAIPAKPGYGIVAQTMNNITVDGCYFGQLGYYQQTAPIGGSSLKGQGLACNAGCNGLVITNCEFTQIRNPIQLLPGGNICNVTIANCSFHDQMEWAITALHNINTYRSNLCIVSCTFSNTDQYYVSATQGGLWTGYGEGPHQNAIMMFGAEGCNGNCALDRPTGDTNVLIYNNYIVDTMGHPGGTTCFWFQDGTSADVYNNVFNCAAANNEISVSEPPTNTVFHVGIYNNTIYGGAPHVNIAGIVGYGGDWVTSMSGKCVIVQNNLASTLNIGNNNAFDFTVQCSTNTFSKFTNNVFFDYNFYFSDQNSSGGMVFGLMPVAYWNGGWPFYLTTNSSPKYYGWDSHSITAASAGFVSASPSYPANNNLRLSTNSPAVGKGINLSSLNLPGLSFDKDGNPRLATGKWTIGAYEAGGGQGVAGNPSTLAPPQGLHVIVAQ